MANWWKFNREYWKKYKQTLFLLNVKYFSKNFMVYNTWLEIRLEAETSEFAIESLAEILIFKTVPQLATFYKSTYFLSQYSNKTTKALKSQTSTELTLHTHTHTKGHTISYVFSPLHPLNWMLHHTDPCLHAFWSENRFPSLSSSLSAQVCCINIGGPCKQIKVFIPPCWCFT